MLNLFVKILNVELVENSCWKFFFFFKFVVKPKWCTNFSPLLAILISCNTCDDEELNKDFIFKYTEMLGKKNFHHGMQLLCTLLTCQIQKKIPTTFLSCCKGYSFVKNPFHHAPLSHQEVYL
jgi:hypothetical protein